MSISNPRFPHHCTITRHSKHNPLQPQSEDVVVYDGVCRSFDVHTTSDRGEVITSERKLALPTKQDEWSEETLPREGDKVVVDKFGYKEYGLVVDRMPGNLGTHLLWRYGRN